MNPIVLSPSSRFNAEYCGESRSPSRSPNRRKYFTSHELDPLLSNLSPTSTLEALEATDVLTSEGRVSHNALQDSVAAASTSERALGIRAALAGKKLKEWHKELVGWPWPSTPEGNGFRPPVHKECGNNGPEFNNETYTNDNCSNTSTTSAWNADREEYYGSVPAKIFEEYENRIETIKDDMEALDLEALKGFVRDAHATSNSRSHSRRMQGNDMNAGYNHLDDFTAVITATIMQALPTISRLTSILSVWSIRLLVLRQVPGYLSLLHEVRVSMKSAWGYLNDTEGTTQTEEESSITRATLLAKRAALETKIFGVGRGLDNMLDILEGREDTIPEEWIDDMESTEVEFGDWVVESEKKLIEAEWKAHERTGPADFSEPKQNHAFEDDTAVSFGPEDPNAVIGKPNESAEIEISSSHFPSSHSRPISPQSNQSEEHKENEGRPIPDPKEEPNNLSSPILRTNNILPGASLMSTSCNKNVAPELPELVVQPVDEKSFRESSAQSVENEMLESVRAQGLPTATPGVTENGSSLELAMESPHRDNHFHSQLNQHQGEICSQAILDSPPQPQSDIHHFLEDQPSTINIPQSSFNDGDNNGDNNGDNKASIETSDIDLSRLPIAVDSSAPKSFEIQLPDHSKAKRPGVPRPAPLVIKRIHSNIESTPSEISSDTSYPGSGTSEYFSNMSSPEIQHASVAEYFDNPVEISTPSRLPSTPLANVSRQSSQRTERGEIGIYENGSPKGLILPINHRRRASTFAPVYGIPEITGSIDESPSHRGYLKSHIRVRSASLRSFEIIPRNEVRNITISRKGSYSCATPEPSVSEPDLQGQTAQSPSTFHVGQESTVEPLNEKPKPLFQNRDEEAHDQSAQGSEDESRTPAQTITPRQSPRVPTKSRPRFESVSDLSPGSTSAIFRRRKTADVSNSTINHQTNITPLLRSGPTKSSEDQLEERISSILTEIPGHIQLRSGPEPDAREVLPLGTSSDRKKANVLSPTLKLMRTRTSAPSPPLTLSPAHPKMSRSRTQAGEPEVKLYHLHQVGKDVPVKLFVRLVGEGGERVMVRIGGGWADLGEYLKEYASHHGRRSVSDGRFEIQGLPQPQSTTPISALIGGSSPAASPASRPSSSSAGAGSSVLQRRSRHSTSSSAELDGPMTPDNHTYRQFEPTPGSVESNTSLPRPPSRLSSTDDDSPLGLAGPKTRRKDVSPSKQAWVDGMVDQARKASAEKKKGQDGDFGDLGKVGTTKRVFMKSRRDT